MAGLRETHASSKRRHQDLHVTALSPKYFFPTTLRSNKHCSSFPADQRLLKNLRVVPQTNPKTHPTLKMSGTSSVGQGSVYEDGDQRNPPNSEIKEAERYKEGKPNSHLANDSSTSSSITLYLIT